jgi:hypothetical protein
MTTAQDISSSGYATSRTAANDLLASSLDFDVMPDETPEAIYQLPKAFYLDHIYRDLPGGWVTNETAKNLSVSMTQQERDELLSDAEFYVDQGTQVFGREMMGMIASARATIKALS